MSTNSNNKFAIQKKETYCLLLIKFQIGANKTLDRERQSVLRLEIEAMDTPKGGSDRLKSSATILIDVLDVDDNSPSFEKNIYTGNNFRCQV